MKTIAFFLCFVATAPAAELVIRPDDPNAIVFPAQRARFVRLVVQVSSASQPCIDEWAQIELPADLFSAAIVDLLKPHLSSGPTDNENGRGAEEEGKK